MALTVNSAFFEFMKDSVNLDSDVVSAARTSRDNLLDNIAEFNEHDDFLHCVLNTTCTLDLLREKQNAESWMMLT